MQRLQQLPRRILAVTTYSAGQRCPLPWRALWRLAWPLWLLTRLSALLVTYLAETLLTPHTAPVSLLSLISDWRLWDGGFYGRILVHGYTASDPITAGFWPLYPLLARPLLPLFGGAAHWQPPLLVVSNLATLVALLLLGALAVQELETLGAAERAMLLLVATPLALFLTAAYSDSLFLAFLLAALLTARRGQWRLAASAAFLAALSRPVGMVLIAPLLWEYGRQMAWQARRLTWDAVPLIASVPVAMASFSLVCLRVYGDPLAWLHVQQRAFQHVLMTPWSSLDAAWRQFARLTPGSFTQARALVDALPLLFVLVFTLVTVRRIPTTYTLLLAGILLTILCSPVVGAIFPEMFVSAGRYLLPAVPCYLLGAQLLKRYPWLERPLLSLGFAAQTLLIAFVVTGGWLV